MPTYRLTIAYDGTDFAGWQKQEPPECAESGRVDPGLVAGRPGRVALRTVQAVVERAVREVVREPVRVQGASRTDAGVHAKCQVGVFACGGDSGSGVLREGHGSESRATGGWPAERGVDRLRRAINSRLPDDVLVVAAGVAPEGFDPIGDCVAKGYSYTLWSGPDRPLWERRRVWHTWATLDLEAMREAAACFVGEHDFAAFAAAGHGRLSTVREVFQCEVVECAGPDPDRKPEPHEAERGSVRRDTAEPGRLIRMDISGSGFLYNMVRIIAGTLHEVGRGRIYASEVPRIIESLDRRRAGPTLPPQGLCLEWIRYRDEGDCRPPEARG
jgi:tRNA pseudouridine38-40 synthase